MPELNGFPKDVANVTRDAAYVAVGLGVIGFQRAQVQRQALRRRLRSGELDEMLVGVRANLSKGVQEADGALEQAIAHLEYSVAPLERQLPPPVREVVDQAHVQARRVRGQIRSVVRSAL